MRKGLHVRRFQRFLKGRLGRGLAAAIALSTLLSCVDFANYAFAAAVERNKREELYRIAANLKIDPAFLLGRDRSSFSLSGLVASLAKSVGLAQTRPGSAEKQTDISASIQTVKSRYALVAADAVLAQLARLLESAASPAFQAKHSDQLQATADSVSRLIGKDFLPDLPPGLPGVASARHAQMKNAVNQLRSLAKDILKNAHALEKANLNGTLASLRGVSSDLLTLPVRGARWTRDAYPVKDTARSIATSPIGPGIPAGAAVSAPSALGGFSPGAGPRRGASSLAVKATSSVPADIQTLAQSLGTPAKVFAYVHDRVAWESYAGVAKGSLGTLKEGRGNDWDQALLLRDLLTALGYQAQLEWGTVTLPIAQAMNLVGTEDPLQAGNLLATAGFDALALTVSGSPVSIRMTHAWVRAAIPYVENRGATAGPADTSVRMDPSFKRNLYQPGIPINGKVAWGEDDYLQNSTVRPPVDYYGDKIWAYIRANNIVCQNLSQVGKAGSIIAENFPFVPATLTAKIENIAGTATDPPASQLQTVALTVTDSGGGTLATYAANLSDAWGKKLTLTFPPATPDDEAIIASYGGLFSTPAYLIRLKPVFSLDDQAVATGAAVPAGAFLSLSLVFHQPGAADDSTRHGVVAGETHTEVFDPGIVPDSLLLARTARVAGLSGDALLSEKLFLAGLRYFQHVDDGVAFATSVRWQRAVKRAFEADVSRRIDVDYNVAGAPIRLRPAENNIDATRLQVGVIPIGNDLSNKAEALSLAGLETSYREGAVWEEVESQQGISAVKALLLSRMAGQTLYTANSGNVESVLAAASLPADVEAEIRGAVAQGRIAKLASAPITLNKWGGTGYILEDAATGAATYPISGGFAGGSDTGGPTGGVPDLLGSEPWLEGSPLGDLLRQLLALLGGGGGSSSSGTPATNQSDPVNLSTGNMFRTVSDFSIVARGLPVVLTRTYNSRSTYNGPFGFGWTFNYGESVRVNPDGSITYREADGTEHLFARNPDSTFASPPGKHITLTPAGPGYSMRFKDGLTYGFDANGSLASQKDLNGNTVTINRDVSGNVTTVVDAPGRTVLTFTTTGGKTTRVADLAGRTVVYGYSGDDLVSVTDTAGKTWTYAYDLSHNMTSLADPLGNAQSFDYDTDDRLFHHVDATGAEEFFHYDIAGRQSVLTDKREGDRFVQFDDTGRATLEADPAGNVVKADWDADNNRTKVLDSRGFTTSYQYDPQGNLTRQAVPDTGVVTTNYDSNSRPLTTTDALGSTTTNQYDSAGNLLQTSRDASGVTETTKNTYDATGQLLTTTDPNSGVTTFAWNGNGAMTSRKDAANNTTTMTPDALGRITSIKDSANNATSLIYDGRDRILTLTDPYTNATSFAYDAAGRRALVTTPRGTTGYAYDGEGRVLTVTDPLSNKSTTTYDAAGNVLTRTDPRGNVTRYEYDPVGRVTKMTDGNGGVWTYGYCAAIGGGGATCPTCSGGGGGSFCLLTDPNGNTIKQDFDVMGRVNVVTDSLGHTMTTLYDKNGRKTLDTDGSGRQTQYGYDEAGRLVSVTEANNAVTVYTYDKNGNKLTQKDANGHTWTFAYDALNRLTSETDPLNRVATYSYDALGNLKTKTDAKNQTITYGYQIRRLTTMTYPNSSVDSFTYDTLGRRTGMSNANGAFTYAYDALNRVTSVTNQRFATTLSYAYDAMGNRTKLTTSRGDVAYVFDGKNRLTTITDPVFGSFGFTYDGMDRRTKLTYPNGITTTYQYDKAYRLTAMAAKDSSSNVVDAWSYAYDPVGNRTSKTDKDGKAETYQYDLVYRLTRAAYSNGTFEAFTYDQTGNRLTRQDGAGTITYSYDVANQMLTAGTDAYTYDANGNVSAKTTGGGAVTTFTYDFQNRNTQITAPTGSETSQYSPDGSRVFLNNAGISGAIGPIYDQIGNPVLDMDGAGSVGIYRLYGPGIDEPLGEWRRATNQTTFLHHDALNSVTMVSNSTGAVNYRIAYTAFGERTQTAPPTGIVPTRLSYTSRENSVGSLMQYRTRFYDGALGRFTSVDTYRGAATSPPSLHRYAYGLNNPVRYADPTGRAAFLYDVVTIMVDVLAVVILVLATSELHYILPIIALLSLAGYNVLDIWLVPSALSFAQKAILSALVLLKQFAVFLFGRFLEGSFEESAAWIIRATTFRTVLAMATYTLIVGLIGYAAEQTFEDDFEVAAEADHFQKEWNCFFYRSGC